MGRASTLDGTMKDVAQAELPSDESSDDEVVLDTGNASVQAIGAAS